MAQKHIYCKICSIQTIYPIKLFSRFHLYPNHDKMTMKEYYDIYYKKDKEDLCIVCNKKTEYITFFHGYRKTCSRSCSTRSALVQQKLKESSLFKYGVENISKSEIIKEKKKNTNIMKYGVEHNWCSGKLRDELNNRFKNKYGTLTPFENKNIQNKIKETNIQKYGVDNPSKNNEIKDKIKKTNLIKYGFESVLSNNNVHNKSEKTKSINKLSYYKKISTNIELEILSHNRGYLKCKCSCGNEFEIQKQLFFLRLKTNRKIYCQTCEPFDKPSSFMEKELYEFVKNNYSNIIINNDRNILKGLELDLYLPELKLAFEFNGLYWHNELNKPNDYHLNKTEECLKQGIKLIHVYEDDWLYKNDIVKSRILNLLNKSERIFARKCEIKEVSYNDSKEFLTNNHIQGSCLSSIRYGLYYNNELISLMTFGKSRFEKDKIELLRFCNKLGVNIIGGASRLFKHYIKNNEFKEIISYADRSWSNGNVYKQLGFKFISKTKPNYYYIINGIRENRFNFRKSILIKEGFNKDRIEHEIMLERKIYRIYDSGSLKFSYYK